MKTICCKGELISFETPKVMAIVNLTPDSFYATSRTSAVEVVEKVEKMLSEGADFIDIGGYSSRPNAENISENEELNRVIPILETLVKEFPQIKISVDTFRAKVAEESLLAGACMINDISAAAIEPEMWEVVKKYQVPYIAMHMKGTPQTMHNFINYENLVKEILFYFSEKKKKATEIGLNDFIIDLGFGFSKTLEQNYELLKHLNLFQILDAPILVGISRKSMIYNLLKTSPEEALNGTSVLNTFSILNGADILRVHDVKEAVECIKMINLLK